MSKGNGDEGLLGVNIQDVTDDLAAIAQPQGHKGALVSEVVEGGPADKAGVKRGDVITGFQRSRRSRTAHELASTVAATPVDREAPLRIIRDGKEMTLHVKVGKLESQEP